MNKIGRLSRVLKCIFIGLLFVFPVIAVLFWIWPEQAMQLGISFGMPPNTAILHVLSASEKWYGFLLQLVPNLMVMGILYYFAKLFSQYEQGKIFNVLSTRCLKKVSILLLASELLTTLLIDPITQLMITMHNRVHHAYISITFVSSDLYTIIAALIFMVIAWIMAEAAKLQADQALTV